MTILDYGFRLIPSSKYLRLPDGGTLGVDFTPPFSKELDPSTPIIVVDHGLTGGERFSGP